MGEGIGGSLASMPPSALTQTDGAAEVSPSLMPAEINRAGSRGGNASVMVAAESFERVSALVCQAGLVSICVPPHWLHRSRRPASGTTIVSGNVSTFTSALCPQD
jgi:hypothetical protein